MPVQNKLITTLLILISFNLYAGRKFVILNPDDEIPKDKFIFIITNAKTGETHLGYSKETHDPNIKGSKGMRNGGHAALLANANSIVFYQFIKFCMDSIYIS